MSEHKPLAPGTIVFHPARGYGVLTAVNLLTGWVSARFGNEVNTLDLSLSDDGLAYADGTPILFRRTAPDYMPHARLMAMVRALHGAGYERLYLYTWPKPSGLHWRWHLFTGRRDRARLLGAAAAAAGLVRLGLRLQLQSGDGLGRRARRDDRSARPRARVARSRRSRAGARPRRRPHGVVRRGVRRAAAGLRVQPRLGGGDPQPAAADRAVRAACRCTCR